MKTPREQRELLSRLPDDDAYWESLTERLIADAAAKLREYRRPAAPWWRALARVALPMAVGAAATVVAAFLWLPDPAGVPAADPRTAALYGLAPSDPLAAPLVAATEAPTIATLLATQTSEGAP